MSRRRARRGAFVAGLALLAAPGCWEQLDGGDWFPQMKRQPAVQAFEYTGLVRHPQGFAPPEGAVPIDGGEAPVSVLDDTEADALVNPVLTDLRSLENGKKQYLTFCSP